MRIFTFFIYATILFFLSFIIVVPAMGFYQNDFKPLMNGYKKIDKSNLKHNGENINEDIFMYIHYLVTFDEEARQYYSIEEANLNEAYFSCVKDNKIFNISCMKTLQNKGQEFLIDDKCAWTFFGHSNVARDKNYYLVSMQEKMCGTFLARFNTYYVFEYKDDYLRVTNTFLTGKDIFNPIKYYKTNDDGFSFVTEACAHGADTCWGSEADWLELKFEK